MAKENSGQNNGVSGVKPLSMFTFCFPPLRRDLKIQRTEDGHFIISDVVGGNVYRLGEVELNVLRELDGMKTFSDILYAVRTKLNYDIAENSLLNFLEEAIELNILQSDSLKKNTDSQHTATGQSILNYEIITFRLNKLINVFYKYFKYIFDTPFILLTLVLISVAIYFTLIKFPNIMLSEITIYFIPIICFLYLTSFIHEIAHGLSCKHNNVEIDELGVKLLCFIPVFFIKYQEIWLKPKKARMLIRISGVVSETVLYSILYFTNVLLLHSHFISLLLFVLLVKIIINLIPFLPNDGYYILSEIINEPNLMEKARMCALRIVGIQKSHSCCKNRAVIFFYCFMGLGFWLFFIIYIVKFIGIQGRSLW